MFSGTLDEALDLLFKHKGQKISWGDRAQILGKLSFLMLLDIALSDLLDIDKSAISLIKELYEKHAGRIPRKLETLEKDRDFNITNHLIS